MLNKLLEKFNNSFEIILVLFLLFALAYGIYSFVSFFVSFKEEKEPLQKWDTIFIENVVDFRKSGGGLEIDFISEQTEFPTRP